METVDLPPASLGQVPRVYAADPRARHKTELAQSATGAAQLPLVRSEQLGKICVADPRPSVDLSQQASRQRFGHETGRWGGEAAELIELSRGAAYVGERGECPAPGNRLGLGQAKQPALRCRETFG